ncbi:MAG TPA: hypothetical protein PLJ17_05495 [Syntrophorhabdaceae bacterium]|nr:hypothetical protein [Syntrophorhabdaceae bacterium]
MIHKSKKALCFVWDNFDIIDSCLKFANTLRLLGVETIFITREDSLKSLFISNNFIHFSLYNLMKEHSIAVKKWFEDNEFESYESIVYKDINVWDDLYFEKKCLKRKYRTPLETSYKQEMIVKAMLCIEAFDNLIKKYIPQYCFVWNGLVYPPKGLRSLSIKNNIPTFSLERGLLPGYLVVDPKGINYGGSLGGESWLIFSKHISVPDFKEIKLYIEKFRREKKSVVTQKDYISKRSIYKILDIPKNKKIIFLPNQIDSDTNIIYYSPFFKTNVDTIDAIIKSLANISDAILVIKTHPEDIIKDMELYLKLLKNEGRIVSSINLHSLIEASHVVIVRNSTVGLEALLYDKPVICLGYSAYSGKGFTINVTDSNALHNVLVDILKEKKPEIPNKNEFYRFLSLLLDNYHFKLNFTAEDEKRNRLFLKNLLSLKDKEE